MAFPNIDHFICENSEWSTDIFGCFESIFKSFTNINVLFDMGSFDNSSIRNNLSNLESITITETNLRNLQWTISTFIKTNLNAENLKEFNIKENFNIEQAYFSEPKEIKLFRIGTGMIFPRLCKMDQYDLIEYGKIESLRT